MTDPGFNKPGTARRPFAPPEKAAASRSPQPAGPGSPSGSRSGFAGGQAGQTLAIPRSQKWMFWSMLLLVVGMAVYLIRLQERASDHFAAAAQALPLSETEALAGATEQPLRLYLANDADGALVEKPIRFPLPSDPNARARVVLEKLLEEYAAAGSSHPLHTGTGVEEVFLLPVPGTKTGLLAVVDLTNTFAENHPSGIEPETLTLLSMIATLKTNLPQVTQVRFLVDGQQQTTLAGHADLTRTYLAAGTQMVPGAEFSTDGRTDGNVDGVTRGVRP